MAKHIGIVACSVEGAALCYRTIGVEGEKYLGRHAHPEISLHTHPLGEYMKSIEAADWDGVARLMLDSVGKVAAIGAEFAVCPDNTIHQAFELVQPRSPIPWLHIAEEVAREAQRRRFHKVGVLGTRFLMEGPVYPPKLNDLNIECAIPEETERIRINQIIFDELVYGRILESSRRYFYEVIQRLKENGCDAVALSCTEIPLIVEPEASPLSTLDSTRLLARAALRHAVEGKS